MFDSRIKMLPDNDRRCQFPAIADSLCKHSNFTKSPDDGIMVAYRTRTLAPAMICIRRARPRGPAKE